MLMGSDKTFLFLKPKGKKLDLDALANSVNMSIEVNKYETNFWTGMYLASQGILATIFVALLSLGLLNYILYLVIVEILISIIFMAKIRHVHKWNNSLIETYHSIQTKKANGRILSLEGDSIEDHIAFLEHMLEHKMKAKKVSENKFILE